MKTSTPGKILVALAFVSMIGGLSVGPALGEDNDRRDRREPQQNRREHVRDSRGRDGWRDDRGWHQYQPVYAPPPVVYAPSPSPGISLFFPFFR